MYMKQHCKLRSSSRLSSEHMDTSVSFKYKNMVSTVYLAQVVQLRFTSLVYTEVIIFNWSDSALDKNHVDNMQVKENWEKWTKIDQRG